MKNTDELIVEIKQEAFSKKLTGIYGCSKEKATLYAKRFQSAVDEYINVFGKPKEMTLVSAPGRTELGGNHTDHQQGCVLAASINLDIIGVAAKNNSKIIQLQSQGYPMNVVDITDLSVQENEREKSNSLIRGILNKISELGYPVGGFCAYTMSDVLKGSGLSSSAAFEILVGNIINHLFCNDELTPAELAQIGQYAENIYYGKPSGLMDQMASSVGNVVAIDFGKKENPTVEKVEFDFTQSGYALCIIDCGADHADLTDEYAAIPKEMKSIASYFGKSVLREVKQADFQMAILQLRKQYGDRAVLRAMHFFRDSTRAVEEANALKQNDFDSFLKKVKQSGQSSFMYLQNVIVSGAKQAQEIAVALAVCEELLQGEGAYRVHGGGFAGTVQAFVPTARIEIFCNRIEELFGRGSCHILNVRPVGGTIIA